MAEALIADGDPGAARELLDRAHISQVTSSNWATSVELAETDMLAGDLATAAARLEEVSLLGLPGLGFRSDTASREAELLLWSGTPRRPSTGCTSYLRASCRLASHGSAGGCSRSPRGLLASRLGVSCPRKFWAHVGEVPGRRDRVGGPTRDARGEASRLRQLRDGATVDPFAGPVPADSEAYGAVWEAELSELEGAPAAELWLIAADRWRPLPRPYPHAYCLMRYAETLLTTSRARVAATDAIVHAHALARGHQPLLAAIERVARLGGLRLGVDNQADLAVSPQVTAAPSDLTVRELDVLRLLVLGFSNAQIGRELFISPKTASVHVTHILSKLQARTRAHAATIAVGEGRRRGAGQPVSAPRRPRT